MSTEEPKPLTNTRTEDAINYSIPDLVSYLQSTFLPSDFERVKHILLTKEEKMKQEALTEVKRVKQEMGSVMASHAEMALSKLMMEDEWKTYRRECEELREQVLRLKEDKRVASDRETRSEERYWNFVKDVKKQDGLERARFVELQGRFDDMERGKRAAEALVELYKSRFEGLGSRVSRLEEDAKVLMSEKDSVSRRVENGVRAAGGSKGPHSGQTVCVTEVKEKDEALDSQKPGSPIRKEPVSEAVSLNNRMVSPMRSSERHASVGVIEIIDSDDEPMGNNSSASALKRKRASPSGSGDDDGSGHGSKSVGGKMKQNSEVLRSCGEKLMSEQRPERYTSSFLFSKIEDNSSDSTDSEDDWETESDMLLALEKDPELYMRAVCVLYREKCFEEKTVEGLKLPYTQNVEKSDALRGTELAEFLIDGHPQAKLKKSILDLQKQYKRGHLDCKMLATKYSKKLFEIYRKYRDIFNLPFFE